MLLAQRKDDRDVVDFFGGENLIYLTGEPGEAFLVNTAGVHKGSPPRNRDRLVFETLYTMLPTIKNPVDPIYHPPFWRDHQARYGRSMSFDYLAYVNRLVFQHGDGGRL